MKKRIRSILLLCCMVLTLLPTAAFAANELPDVKLSVPATFDKTVVVVKKSRHEKYLFLICFFKSRHEEHFCGSCFFKSGHGQ